VKYSIGKYISPQDRQTISVRGPICRALPVFDVDADIAGFGRGVELEGRRQQDGGDGVYNEAILGLRLA